MRLDRAVEELNKVAANLELLKTKWYEIKELLAYPIEGHWDPDGKQEYNIKCLEFKDLLTGIPNIRDNNIHYLLPDYDDVSQQARQVNDLFEADLTASFYSEIYEQGPEISKYEHVLKSERRKLVRRQVESCLNDVDAILSSLNHIPDERDHSEYLNVDEIKPLTHKIEQLDNLMGDSIQRPPRWSDLVRHLRFGQVHDLNDIILLDWPSIKPAIESSFRENDPFEINTEDIGDLVDDADESGEIVTSLNWDAITPEQFERLCADLLELSSNYENVEWLTSTNAPDRGCDIRADWAHSDETRGTVREKFVIQCKHRRNSNISASDIEDLRNITITYGNVDVYLIITSGKFTDQALQVIQEWNENNAKPKVEVWGDWKLEQLLASHPDLIIQYGLR